MVFALARVMVLSVNRTCGSDCEGIGGRNEGFKAFEYVKSRSISGHRPVRRGIRVNRVRIVRATRTQLAESFDGFPYIRIEREGMEKMVLCDISHIGF